MPFAVATHDGVLTLTLDTPGSPVNVFNHASARQLSEILARVSPADTRAIVFETAKPGSFINGVGLLLAQAARTPDDVLRASTPPWEAYRAVREAPVPTIAVVQGSCFGCGVEFALQCDYRLASDSAETCFYMTEVHDYLFVPLFGSTWNLPEAVGLEAAIALLLWGERWDAATARARGLVDAVAPHEELATRRGALVARVLAGTQPTRRRGRVTWGAEEDRVAREARRRIASLPPVYDALYTDALRLLEAGARQEGTHLEHQRRELAAAVASALAPMGKAAYGFFYLRQIASERAAGRALGDAPPMTLDLDVPADDPAHALADELRRRKLPGMRVERDAPDVRLVGAGCRTNGGPPAVALRVALATGPEAAAELYAPAYGAGRRLVEFAIRSGGTFAPEIAMRLTRLLQRLGYEVARTSPTGPFLGTRLLQAYLVPLVRYVERYGDPGAADAALRRLGFVRRFPELIAAFDRRALAGQLASVLEHTPTEVEAALSALARPASGEADAVVIDALCLSLLEAVLVARGRGDVRDTMVIDLVARELLDFPRHLCSLATWLKIARVASALEGDSRVRVLVTEPVLDAARGFVAAGREFYR